MSEDSDVKSEKPSAKSVSMSGSYNQVYIILNKDEDRPSNRRDAKGGDDVETDSNHEVFFRCGNWCYKGVVQFNGLNMGTADLPVIIPVLQKQQGSLRYFCNSHSVPKTSIFSEPLDFFNTASEFCAEQISSEKVEQELRKWAAVFPWIDDDAASTYFELVLEVPACMDGIALIASKTYVRGLIIISIYCERCFYFIVQSGEGDQALLDVRFPDVSKHGQGLHVQSFHDSSIVWRKLTLWHILDDSLKPKREIPKLKTVNVASTEYEQTYCIMKNAVDESSAASALSIHRDVLFRFGSWCYVGRVQLTASLSLSDIPFVIPALRMQQSRLDFFCDVSSVPINSPFASALEFLKEISPVIEAQIISSEETLRSLIDRLNKMGLGESVSNWLEGDSSSSFFEFKTSPTPEQEKIFRNIDLVASKCYHASGIITMLIMFQHTVYVSVLDGGNENPLLDSRFPDISGKGRGYQIFSHAEGVSNWPSLRKVSIWQTVAALEQEFRARASRLADAKRELGNSHAEACAVNSSTDDAAAKEELKIIDEERTANGNAAQLHHTVVSSTAADLTADEKEVSVSKRSESNVRNSSPPRESSISSLESQAKQSKKSEDLTESKSAYVHSEASSSALSSRPNEPREQSTLDPFDTDRPLGKKSISIAVARPHHLPKVDSLSKRMEEIRQTMSGQLEDAPWDSMGRPRMSSTSKK